MLDEILSIFTIFLYTALGAYVLWKNPNDRTNKFFAVMMFIFMIWSSEISDFTLISLPLAIGSIKEIFLFSSVFAVAGVYLLLRLYGTSRYREQERTKLVLAGSIAAILAVTLAGIVLPMFYDIYFLSPLMLAPAVIGVFFAFAVYRHGHFIIPVQEFSVTSFCGTECRTCHEYIEKRCPGCRFDIARYGKCAAYRCSAEKGYTGCIECHKAISCMKRTQNIICFSSNPSYHLKPGIIYTADDKGFEIFIDSVRNGAFGIIASTTNPYIIKERYGLITTPMIWISRQGGESDVRPNDLKRLALLLTNFMKKIDNSGNSIILLDGSGTLFRINGLERFEGFMKTMGTAASSTKSAIIVTADYNDEQVGAVFRGIENPETPELSGVRCG